MRGNSIILQVAFPYTSIKLTLSCAKPESTLQIKVSGRKFQESQYLLVFDMSACLYFMDDLRVSLIKLIKIPNRATFVFV